MTLATIERSRERGGNGTDRAPDQELGGCASRRRYGEGERSTSSPPRDHSPHFHLHLFPRYPGTPEDFWFVRVDEWSGSPRGGAAEITAFVENLRDAG
jgi:hypothetical protein